MEKKKSKSKSRFRPSWFLLALSLLFVVNFLFILWAGQSAQRLHDEGARHHSVIGIGGKGNANGGSKKTSKSKSSDGRFFALKSSKTSSSIIEGYQLTVNSSIREQYGDLEWFTFFSVDTANVSPPCQTLPNDLCLESNRFPSMGRPLTENERPIMRPPENKRQLTQDRMFDLLGSVAEIKSILSPLLEKINRLNTITVIVTNSGFTSLLDNWRISAELGGVNISNTLIFCTSMELSQDLGSKGFNTFYHEALGKFPERAAKQFGDGDFMILMWLKTVSVWLILEMGYHCLFQDSDLVWFADPLPAILSNQYNRFWPGGKPNDPESLAEPADVYFMDDGTRGRRFSPYYGNSGFFLIRSTPTSKLFWDSVLSRLNLMFAWQSQQLVVNHQLAESCRLGLKVRVLCETAFANGRVGKRMDNGEERGPLHQVGGAVRQPGSSAPLDPDQVKKSINGGEIFHPMVFHINWTDNIEGKVNRMRRLRLWFLGDEEADRIVADIEQALDKAGMMIVKNMNGKGGSNVVKKDKFLGSSEKKAKKNISVVGGGEAGKNNNRKS